MSTRQKPEQKTGAGGGSDKPGGPGFVADMVEAQIVKHHGAPVLVTQFVWDMPRDVVVNLGEVLPPVSVKLTTITVATSQ